MKTNFQLTFVTQHPACTALMAAFTLFTTSPRAPAQTGWGNALSFDGTDDYVRVSVPALASNYTVSAWVFLRAGGNWPGIRVGVLSATGCSDSIEVLIHSMTASYTDPQYLELGRCGVFEGDRSTETVPTNQWVHVAVTVSSSKQVNYFINGNDAGSWDASSRDLTLGPNITLGDNSVRAFNGLLDDVRIWNRARSQAEIQADMSHPPTGSESNLVACWLFDEGAGSRARDATSLGNTGVLVNGPAWETRVDQPLMPFPRMQATWGAPDEVLLSGDAVPGTGFRILTTTNLPTPWEPLSGYPALRATNDLMTHPVTVQPGANFFRAELEPMVYAITDVMVSDNSPSVALEYTGLGYNVATLPYIPDAVGARVVGNDVNIGIGGSTTCIWAKYRRLGAWLDAATPVLTDIAVVHWVGWNAVCPDGHPLSGASPCVDGWQRASGTSAGIQGALTTGTASACWRNGLVARYQPIGQVVSQDKPYILKLSLSMTTGGVVYPPGEVDWSNASLDIHAGCGDSRYVFVCFKKESFIAPPTDEDKLELLRRYAPMVWLQHGEQFMPSSVDWAFPYLQRFLSSGGYWLRTTNQLATPSDYTLAVFAGHLSTAPVYAFWVEKQPGFRLVDLVYLFYYPYNRGKEVINTIWGNHVGDWEHITVRLIWGQPDSVYIAAHSFGSAVKWNSISKTNLTHPIIYSAWGSHGSWLTPGRHIYRTINDPILGIKIADLYDDCSAGTAWTTWERMETFDYYAQKGLGTNSWPVWMSTDYSNPGTGDPSIPGHGPIYRWGNPEWGCDLPDWLEALVGRWCRLENGVTGPAAMGLWNPNVFQ